MRVGSWGQKFGLAIALSALIAACGGGGDSENPSISIIVPTSTAVYSTTWGEVRLGGAISRAGYVHVRNALTGFTTEGYVFYNQGQGSWFADVYGLGLGENPITVTADADGRGVMITIAQITVIRPLQPADLILNGPNQYWADANSIAASHKIALFGDGTGRSTTGSALSENAGGATDFTWTKIGPDSIMILNCSTCSFQKISRIAGALSEELFYGQIVTVGGNEQLVSHVFELTSGNL